MTLLENKENVSLIIMHPRASVKCRIGKDWYVCEFDVEFVPDKYYPDYMEVAAFVMNCIDGKELNIEEAARALYDYLLEYRPVKLWVTNHVQGCKTHFDVDVTIE